MTTLGLSRRPDTLSALAVVPDETAITIVAARYYVTEKAAFTHHIAIPATRAIRRAAGVDPDRIWLERHWLRGPFVGVAVSDTVPSDRAEPALTRAVDLLGAGVRALPSSAPHDPAQLLARAATAGRIEGIPGPYLPIRPDNTVDLVRPDRSHLVRSWGSPAALALRDRLLARALDLVDLACARHAEEPGLRVHTALTTMALHATSYAPGASGGAMSFLSHLEDFLHHQPEVTRARFAAAWTGRGDELTDTVARLLAGRTRTALEQAAHNWSHGAVALARTAYESGHVPLLPPETAASGETDLSAFHRWVPTHFDPHAVAADFGPYRCATNALYAVFVLADVRPVERYLAAYLLSRAVTRLTGVDWVELANSGSPAGELSPVSDPDVLELS